MPAFEGHVAATDAIEEPETAGEVLPKTLLMSMQKRKHTVTETMQRLHQLTKAEEPG
jgi:hypothetical protein